jgi:hypothetical protein
LRYREPRLPWICTIKGALIDYTLIIDFSIAILERVESAQIGQTLELKASPGRKSASYAPRDSMRYLLMIKV